MVVLWALLTQGRKPGWRILRSGRLAPSLHPSSGFAGKFGRGAGGGQRCLRRGGASADAQVSSDPDPQVRTLPAWQARQCKFPHPLPLPITDCSRTSISRRIRPPVMFQSLTRGVGRERVRRLARMSLGGLDCKLSFPFWSLPRPCVKTLILLGKKHSA